MLSSPSEVFLGKCVAEISSKFTGEHPTRTAISMKLLCNFIEIALRHGCFHLNLLHIFRTPFPKNTSWGLVGVFRKRCFENKQQTSGEYPCWSVISIKLLYSFIEISLRHGCSPVNLLHLFRTPFCKSTYRVLLLIYVQNVHAKRKVEYAFKS